ncbi:MAG: WD40 repeat domain-containing protein [Bacteroidia bacterium]|nr:WD40 repeat domain-containing protein [Bacteroidia bacterium]
MLHKTCFLVCGVLLLSLGWSKATFAQVVNGDKVLGRHQDDVESVAIAPNDFYVATGSWDNTVQVFSGDSSFRHLQTLDGHNAAVSAISFSGKADRLVTAGRDYKIMIWNRVGEQKFELERELNMVHTAGINSLFVGPYGNMIYSGGYDGKIVIYNMRKDSRRIIDNRLPVNDIALSSTRQFIYCADESPIVKMYDGIGNKIRDLKGHTDVVNAVACNNQYILTGSSDQTAIIWDVARGKKKRVLEGHTWKVTSVAISADGKYAITGSTDGTTKIWDIETGKEVKSFSEENAIVRQVVMSRNMQFVFTAMHMDTSVHYESYGASVWRSGLEFDPTVVRPITPEMVHGNPTMARRGGSSQTRATSRKTRPAKQPEKPKINPDAEIITNTNEIQITIEDE